VAADVAASSRSPADSNVELRLELTQKAERTACSSARLSTHLPCRISSAALWHKRSIKQLTRADGGTPGWMSLIWRAPAKATDGAGMHGWNLWHRSAHNQKRMVKVLTRIPLTRDILDVLNQVLSLCLAHSASPQNPCTTRHPANS
jgi:hypothetical protein